MNNERPVKFLGHPNYGSIGHLPGSKVGEHDKYLPEGQAAIATTKTRDKHDIVIVQEKLDGANVGVYMNHDGELVGLSRNGYLVEQASYQHLRDFATWIHAYHPVLKDILRPGERLVGEWLICAHGTRYHISTYRECFVAFDIMRGTEREPYFRFTRRVNGRLPVPALLHLGGAISIDEALRRLGEHGHYNALDEAEGVVYRVERYHVPRKNARGLDRLIEKEGYKVDFLAKYVRDGKIDGRYFPDNNNGESYYNYSWL